MKSVISFVLSIGLTVCVIILAQNIQNNFEGGVLEKEVIGCRNRKLIFHEDERHVWNLNEMNWLINKTNQLDNLYWKLDSIKKSAQISENDTLIKKINTEIKVTEDTIYNFQHYY